MSNYVQRGSFLGFTYNNIHSSTLGISRIISNRYDDNLIPTLKDVKADIVGAPGVNYFGTTYTKREISVSFAFDSMTQRQIRELYEQWNGKEIHDLMFDEWPYKIYSAKITGQSLVKYVSFDIDNTTCYKGEGTIKFTCYFPFARSRYVWQEQYTVDNIPEWQDDNVIPLSPSESGNLYYDFDVTQPVIGSLVGLQTEFAWVNPQSLLINTSATDDETDNGYVDLTLYQDTPFVNYYDWIVSSEIPSRANYGIYNNDEITLYNAGDILMPSIWRFAISDTPQTISLTCGSLNLTLTDIMRDSSPTQSGTADKWIIIDMPNYVILGYDKYMNPTGHLYNSYTTRGEFFGIPHGAQTIRCTVQPEEIKFNYLYL